MQVLQDYLLEVPVLFYTWVYWQPLLADTKENMINMRL